MIYHFIANQLPPPLRSKLLKKCEEHDDPLNVLQYIKKTCEAVCSMIDQKTVTPRFLPEIIKKIEKTCTKKTFIGGCQDCGKWEADGGGSSMPLSFYGMSEDMYSPVGNFADMLNVDFEKGILRPEISAQEGGAKGKWDEANTKHKIVKMIAKALSSHCRSHRKSLSKQVKYYLTVYIYMKIDCLINKIKKDNSLNKGMSLTPT